MPRLSPRELVNQNIKLVSLPAIVSKLNEQLLDPKATTDDITHTISQDAVLSVRLLKIVNSPFYQFPTKIDTISMAIAILGTRQLRDLVLSSAVIRQFSNSVNKKDFDVDAFWSHSITAAIASQMIALNLALPDSEQYFIAGLLHDIGKMIMSTLLPEESKKLETELNKNTVKVCEAENKIFGFDHAILGAELLRSWHFPDSLIEPIRQHHKLQDDSEYLKGAAIVHIADVVANNLYAPISVDDDNVLDPRAMDALGFSDEMLEKVHEDTYNHMDDLLQVLYHENVA